MMAFWVCGEDGIFGFLGESTGASRVELGWAWARCCCCSELRRMKDDAFLNGVPRLAVTAGGTPALTVPVVRTIGADADVPTGRMITSPPSKLRTEPCDSSSVSGVTASVLTMAGYNPDRSNRR